MKSLFFSKFFEYYIFNVFCVKIVIIEIWKIWIISKGLIIGCIGVLNLLVSGVDLRMYGWINLWIVVVFVDYRWFGILVC